MLIMLCESYSRPIGYNVICPGRAGLQACVQQQWKDRLRR